MSQLGIAPLVLVAGGATAAAAGSGATIAAQNWWERFGQFRTDSIMQYLGLKKPPSIPQSPSPAFAPPPAPQTASKLTTWSPDDLWEATVQRSQQYAKDMTYMRSAGTSAPLIQPLPGDRSGDNTKLWLVLGAGAFALVLLIRR